MQIFSWFKGLKLKLSFILLLGTLAQMPSFFFDSQSTLLLKSKFEYLVRERIPSFALYGEAKLALGEFHGYALEALLTDLDPKLRVQLIQNSEESLRNAKAKVEKMKSFKLSEKLVHDFSRLSKAVDELALISQDFFVLLKESRFESDLLAKKAFLSRISPSVIEAKNLFKHLEVFQEQSTSLAVPANENKVNLSNYWISLLAVGLFWLVGQALAVFITKKLRQVTANVDTSVHNVSTSAENLSTNAQQLSTGAHHQAIELEEAARSLEEIAGMIESNVINTEDSLVFAKNAKNLTEETNGTILSLSDSMREILLSNDRIEVFSTRIEEIGAKTEVIDDIVFQTKILSFNASVEAERAGELGRGFGVVAQEVGNLAAMSGQSAIEIASIVKSAMKESREIISENKIRVKKGADLCQLSVKKMRGVIEATEKILESCELVLRASKEQSNGIRQISTSVDSLNQATQSNAGNAETLAESSQYLTQLSISLNSQVVELHRIVDGSGKPQKLSLDQIGNKLLPLKQRQKFKIKHHEMKKVSGDSSDWDKI